MKKLILSLAAACLLSATAMMAQAPNRFSYQTVVRNSTGTLLANSQVGVKISILKGTATGASQYEERHTPTTNANGLVDLQIGGGNLISGAFTTINWSNDAYFIKTEIDPTGGSAYTISGTSQILATPFALNGVLNGKLGIGAAVPPASELLVKSSSGNGDVSIMPATGRGWNFGAISSNLSADLRIASFDGVSSYNDLVTISENGNVGIGTSSPSYKLDIFGDNNSIKIRGNGISSSGGTIYFGDGSDYVFIKEDVDDGLLIKASDNKRIALMAGKVGIGTLTPSNTLDVSGSVGLKGIKSRAGFNGGAGGAYVNGDPYNFWWNGSAMECWVNDVKLGNLQYTSDRRLKENIQLISSNAIERVGKLKPVQFNYKKIDNTFTGASNVVEGFIADELQDVIPSAVDGKKNALTTDGKIMPQTVNVMPIVSVLTKAIQEQQAQIDALKAENKEAKANFQSQLDEIKASLEALSPKNTAKK